MMEKRMKLAKGWSGKKMNIDKSRVFLLYHDPCPDGPAVIWEYSMKFEHMLVSCQYCQEPIPLGVRKVFDIICKLEETM